jgi:hypothetical protein
MVIDRVIRCEGPTLWMVGVVLLGGLGRALAQDKGESDKSFPSSKPISIEHVHHPSIFAYFTWSLSHVPSFIGPILGDRPHLLASITTRPR